MTIKEAQAYLQRTVHVGSTAHRLMKYDAATLTFVSVNCLNAAEGPLEVSTLLDGIRDGIIKLGPAPSLNQKRADAIKFRKAQYSGK